MLGAGCEWVANPEDFTREDVPRFKADKAQPLPVAVPTSLKVMAWNVKYGACRVDFWFDYWGDRVQLTSDETTSCLGKLATLIGEYDPDILMTEEIEVDSKRSAYVDMVRYFLENTNLGYGAYFETWNASYVPSEGLGRINLGNAIFSRYPIIKAERIRQVDRTDQDLLTKTFYIKRAVGRVEIDLADAGVVSAFVVHTEPYDTDGTKQKQLQQIYEILQTEPLPWVIGGDFNELPPVCDERVDAGSPGSCAGKLQLTGFADEAPATLGTPYAQPPYTPSAMKKFYDAYEPYISLARYGVTVSSQQRYFTHSVKGPALLGADAGVVWTRTLDYLFVQKGTAVLEPDGGVLDAGVNWRDTDVLQAQGRDGLLSDPTRLSDHAPIVGTWVLP